MISDFCPQCYNHPKNCTCSADTKRPREWWIAKSEGLYDSYYEDVEGPDTGTNDDGVNRVHVVEKSAYDALATELTREQNQHTNAIVRIHELEAELEKTKHALKLTGEGRPSEWAYTQLLNDFKALEKQLRQSEYFYERTLKERNDSFKRVKELEKLVCKEED